MRYLGTDRTALWLLRALSRPFLRATLMPRDVADRLPGRKRQVLYILEERGVSNLLALEKGCEAAGLRGPLRRIRLGSLSLRRSFLAIERRAGVLRKRPDRRLPTELRELLVALAADDTLELEVIPVAVFWGRAPQKERSWLDLAFSESWALMGPIRRLLAILFNGRATLVRFGEPRPLRGWLEGGSEPSRSARRLLRDLRHEFRQMRLDTLGPELATRRSVTQAVLRSRAVRQAVRQELRERRCSRREALLTARKLVHEIAADYSHAFIRLMDGLLTWLWTRLYDGVDVHNASRLEGLPAGCEVVYVPCHRSHMDYLLLSWVIYHRGFPVPYVAAGINLNLPVIGRFLRKGGGFFIRRSFRGSGLYPAVFTRYVDVMMGRGHPLEFFIEGGRSRSGRMLPPRTGMLAMTVRSFLRQRRRPVAYVPVYFGYERVFEARTYLDELSGHAKRKESILGLLRSLPSLLGRFGRVQVSFGHPILLGDLLDTRCLGWSETPLEADARPPWFSVAVDELAGAVVRGINSAAAITPVNLLGIVLLSTPRQSMVEADLVRQLELCVRLLERQPYAEGAVLPVADGPAMIKAGERLGLLVRQSHPLGDVLRMPDDVAVLSTFYRNNAIHLFALPSLVACAFLNNVTMRGEDVQRLVARVYPFIRQELTLRWEEEQLEGEVEAILLALAAEGLLERDPSGSVWRRSRTGTAEAVQLSLLAQTTVQTLERYYLVISMLLRAGSGQVSRDELEQRCVAMASRIAMLYGLETPEFSDRNLFRDFIALLLKRGVISLDGSGKLAYDEGLTRVEVDARMVLSEQIRNSVLQVTHT